MSMRTYKEAGVDIDAGDRFTQFIQRISSPAVDGGIGGFAGGIELDLKNCRNPVLLSTSDGVGTKLLIAKKLKRYDTIGIDLVAMCVNDLICCGVKAQIFQDYIACGRINDKVLENVITGVVKGCEAAGCKLTGGETAEMPDMYSPDDIDLAGFCAGVGERDALLPKLHEIVAGDSLLGLPSNGVHSNGLSLARKVLSGISDWEQLLLPTKIYVEEVSLLLESRRILGAAHITGGGLTGNILRVLPSHLYPNLEYDWPCPRIFQKIQERGKIEDQEMRRTFNMGIGLVLVVSSQFENEILALAAKSHISLLRIGRVLDRRGESRE